MSETSRRGANSLPDSHIGVLLVYGSQLLSNALVSLLVQDAQIALVGAYLTGQSAANRLLQAHVDVVLCGIRHTDDVARMISPIFAVRPHSRVLVLGPAHSQDVQIACMRAGVAGYISEDVDPTMLLRAIKQVHAGEVVNGHTTPPGVTHQSRRSVRGVVQYQDARTLAPREIEVLRLLVHGLSTDEVAERLSITVSTVRTHLKKSLEKLGAHSKLEAVIIALTRGIIDLPERDNIGSG